MPTITRSVDTLVERGYVERQPDPTDRRCIYLQLTDKGMMVNDDAHAQFRSAVSRFLSPLSEEQLRDVARACDHMAQLLPEVYTTTKAYAPSSRQRGRNGYTGCKSKWGNWDSQYTRADQLKARRRIRYKTMESRTTNRPIAPDYPAVKNGTGNGTGNGVVPPGALPAVEPEEEWQVRPKGQIIAVMASVMLGILLAALDQTIVGPALPKIIGDLNGFEQYSWVITVYLLTSTISVPIIGKLSDMYGRKWFYMAGIVIFLIGSALSGLSANMTELIIYRGIQGLGAGILFACAFTIIADLIPPAERGKWQGLFGAVFGLSS